MQSSDPKLFEYCSKLLSTPEGVKDFDTYNCSTPGFIGAPLHFEYTPESNAKWDNERCDGPKNVNNLKPL
jgi:hypothetical protein